MSLKVRFWVLVFFLAVLNIIDIRTTIIGVEYGTLQEINPFVESYLLGNPTLALYVKIFVPLFACLYLYFRLGLEKKTISVFGRDLFNISSFHVLYFFIGIYSLIALNGLFWVYLIYFFV